MAPILKIRSLRFRVILSVIIPLLVILSAFTVFDYIRFRNAVQDNLSFLAAQSGEVVEANLRTPLLNGDLDSVQTILDSTGSDEHFKVLYVLDPHGEVLFAPNGEGAGLRLDTSDSDCSPCHDVATDERPDSIVVRAEDGSRLFRSMHPIHDEGTDSELIGVLLTDVSVAPLEASASSILQENVLWRIGILAITTIVVNLALDRSVLKRLERLTLAIAGTRKGELPSSLPDEPVDEIGELATAFNRMAQQVRTRDEDLRRLSDDLRRQSAQRGELLNRLITAQEEERKRIARELHDELGQTLGALTLSLDLIDRFRQDDPSRATQIVRQACELTDQLSERIYELILDLRPSALDDLGLVPALRACAERTLNGTGTTFIIDAEQLQGRLPPVQETTLYRVLQEALTNVARHAEAEHVHITLSRQNGYVYANVEDDGRGFDYEKLELDGTTRQGLGLLGMRERVVICNGSLAIHSAPGAGTRIAVRIPVEDAASG